MSTEDTGDRALHLANKSYEWYKTAAIRSRRLHRFTEASTIVLSAVIPIAVLISPEIRILPALAGAAIVVLSGLRSLYRWNENYLRFSVARERIEAERREYHFYIGKYADGDTREQVLVSAVTQIETAEIGQWLEVVSSAQPSPA